MPPFEHKLKHFPHSLIVVSAAEQRTKIFLEFSQILTSNHLKKIGSESLQKPKNFQCHLLMEVMDESTE
jgi:hypothetical protein